ncbi:hypothetical protein AeRB84_012372 [Aphanomyces euteiches]|nr:hypothetical protein AeRB84_012372 [Aphanomyces euteiches]
MSKRKQQVVAEPTPEQAQWLQRFQLLDSCYCFVSSRKAILSLKSILSLAAHISGNAESLTESHVRKMATIGVVHLEVQAKDKIVLPDDFNPNVDPNELVEVVSFPDVPHSSKRASSKRLEQFRKALAKASDISVVPEYVPPPPKKAKPTVPDYDLHKDVPFLNVLTQRDFYTGQVAHVEYIPPRPARFSDVRLQDMGVCEAVIKAVTIDKLFCHQSEAIAALFEGRHVVISTSTSSGKSMVYNIPVAHSLVTSQAMSFFLFPTKALAQDQFQSFASFLRRCKGLDDSICATYDGDTAKADRAGIRKRARVFFTNPDMFNVSILPQHTDWATVLSHLKFIVIDEAHMYRGVFGSHVAAILRRLFRLCYMYGSSPQVVCCSASIMNPREQFEWLVPRTSFFNRDVAVIEQEKDGSPSGSKYFVVWDPRASKTLPKSDAIDISDQPDAAVNVSPSTIHQSAQILSSLVSANVHTIAFCKGRKLTELVLDYTHADLRKQKQGHLVGKVKAYRGGYSVENRRAIEKELFRQDLLGVVSTNALELGIDIGSLEVTLHVGYPSSVASMWQQAGRAGRSGKDSMALIVCFDAPLDAYYKSLGSAMFKKPPEAVVLDPLNAEVLRQHLQSASLELDLLSQRTGTAEIDKVIFMDNAEDFVAKMVVDHELMHYADGFRVPAAVSRMEIAIRDIATDSYSVIDVLDDNKVIDAIPGHRVFFQVYPTAGREYIVSKIDTEAKLVFARRSPRRLKYFTRPRDFTDVDVRITFDPSVLYPPHVHLGVAAHITQVVGCYTVEKRSMKILTRTDFSLPPMESEGHAVWMDIPDHLGYDEKRTRAALHGVNHLILAVIPSFMLVDYKDISSEHVSPLEKRLRPSRVIVFENSKGGVGIAKRLAVLFPQLVICAKKILDLCDCTHGCPRCVHSMACPEFNAAVSKDGARAVLDYMVATLSTSSTSDNP